MPNENSQPDTTEYYTVVYRVTGDKAMQDKWWRDLYPLFLARGEPIEITTVAKGDALSDDADD